LAVFGMNPNHLTQTKHWGGLFHLFSLAHPYGGSTLPNPRDYENSIRSTALFATIPWLLS
jgi:hypothetical protein